jgi:hypothetical protein
MITTDSLSQYPGVKAYIKRNGSHSISEFSQGFEEARTEILT